MFPGAHPEGAAHLFQEIAVNPVRHALAAVLAILCASAQAQHLDVKISTSAGPVAGSRIVLNVFGDIGWYMTQAGGLPIDHDSGRYIFPANFNDAPGGPFATDNPGFQTFANQFVKDEELHFRTYDRLWHLAPGGATWLPAAPGGGIRLMGSIPEDVAFDYIFNGVGEAEYLFYEGGTLFSGSGVSGPLAAPIGSASAQGAFHYHLDWYLEGAARANTGTYLLEMSLFSTATAGGGPKYQESDRFYVMFRNSVTDAQFASSLQTLTAAPASPAPEPGTWLLSLAGLAVVAWVAARRRV